MALGSERPSHPELRHGNVNGRLFGTPGRRKKKKKANPKKAFVFISNPLPSYLEPATAQVPKQQGRSLWRKTWEGQEETQKSSFLEQLTLLCIVGINERGTNFNDRSASQR